MIDNTMTTLALTLAQLEEAYGYLRSAVLIVTARQKNILLFNPGISKLSGYKSTELHGKPFFQLFHPNDHKRLRDMIHAGHATGVYTEFNLKLKRKSGRIFIVNLFGKKHLLNQKVIILFNLQDITELQKSHTELEEKVSLRTAALKDSKQRIELILNHSSQGFLTFNENLQIEDFSEKAQIFLGKNLSTKNICTLLQLNPENLKNLRTLASRLKNWDLIRSLSQFESEIDVPASEETPAYKRILKIELSPILDPLSELSSQVPYVTRMMATLSDITTLKNLEKKSEKTAQEGRMFLKILHSKDIFFHLIQEVSLLRQGDSPTEISAKRNLHTLKGSFSFFEYHEIVNICLSLEQEWAQSPYSETVYLNGLMKIETHLNSFLKKYDFFLQGSHSKESEISIYFPKIQALISEIEKSNRSVDLLDHLECALSQPAQDTLAWLEKAWESLAKTLKKEVAPIHWKTSLTWFAYPYKTLLTSLIHIIRNTVDHGIEFPEERVKKGKSPEGHLTIECTLQNDHYHIKFTDDGRGVPLNTLKEKALQQGSLSKSAPCTPESLIDLIFVDHLSTHDPLMTTLPETQPSSLMPSNRRDPVHTISGQGLGLGTIRAEAMKLKGNITACQLPMGGLELHLWFQKIPLIQFKTGAR